MDESNFSLEEEWNRAKEQAVLDERGDDYTYIMQILRKNVGASSPLKESVDTELADHWQRARAEAIDCGAGDTSEIVLDFFKKRIDSDKPDPLFDKLKKMEGYKRYQRLYT